MKRFRFRLEPLRKAKEFRERQKQRELAQALSMVRRQQAQLQHTDGERKRTTDEQLLQMRRTFTVGDMLLYSRYLVKLKGDTLAGKEVLRALEAETDKKRLALTEATRERRIYDNLRQKKFSAFVEEVRSVERKEADEIAISNHRRKAHCSV